MDDTLCNEKGFTLIEVMIAIAVVTFGLIGMNFVQAQSVKGNANAIRMTEMTWVAGDVIEENILGKDFTDIVDGTDVSYAHHTVAWTVTQSGSVKNITISVTHTPSNKTLSYDFIKTNIYER